LESQVESLTAENEILNRARSMTEFEVETLRKANERLQAERDAALDASSQMKIILDQAGAAIVQGMQKFHVVRKASPERLKLQEEALMDGPAPRFLEQAAE
jgi:hypothetical protein